MNALAATKPLTVAGPPRHTATAAQHRPRWSLVVSAHQQLAEGGAAAPVDRRALLLGAGAMLAGAAVQQVQPAKAVEAACTLQTSASGLQWCDIAEGSGDAPVAGASIRAHYSGRLASNGVVFDSSYDRGQPLTFPVGTGRVIKGWDMGILGTDDVPAMKYGGKRYLRIPSNLAYGERGAGGVIPPGATLDFTVELVGRLGKR